MLGDALRQLELVAVDGRRVEWIQPTPNPIPGGRSRSDSVTHPCLAVPCDDDPVHLRPVDEALDDRLLRGRLGEREMEALARGRPANRAGRRRAGPPESAGFSTAGRPTWPSAALAACEVAHRGEARLRHARVGQRAAHRHLVRQPMRDVGADRRQPEALRHRGDDRHGAVGRDRERTVHRVALRHRDDRVDVCEVDHLGDVSESQAGCVGVAVDGHDAEAALARLQDRPALVPAGADEQDRLHGGRC